MERKGNFHFRYIIYSVTLVVAIVISVLVGGYSTWRLTDERMQESLHQQAEQQTALLKARIDRSYAILEGFAHTLQPEDIRNKAYIRHKMQKLVEETAFDTLNIAFPDGSAWGSDGRERKISESASFQESLQGRNAIEKLVDAQTGENTGIGVSVPVITGGEVKAVLLGNYQGSSFQKVFTSIDVGVSDFVFVSDSVGDIIAASEVARNSLQKGYQDCSCDNLFDLIRAQKYKEGSADMFVSGIMNQKKGEVCYSFGGELRNTLYEPVGVGDWSIVYVLKRSEIQKEALRSSKGSYLMLLLAVFFLILLMVVLIRQGGRQRELLKDEAKMLRNILEHDELTDLMAPEYFVEKVSEKLRLLDLQDQEWCIVFGDIYKFKLINEVFGRERGDKLLRRVAEQFRVLARKEGGYCARISGDKFALFLPNRQDIIQYLSDHFGSTHLSSVDVYMHFGVYEIQNKDLSVNSMIDCAQIAQKEIKGNYDNYIVFYDQDLKGKMLKEQEIITSMDPALKNKEFVIYLQPQYDYEKNHITGAEALVRWVSPTKGIISPGEFIPVFETNGFITKVDEEVWLQVCRLLRKWIDEGKEPIPISVNVSRADLYRGSVVEKFKKLVETYQLSPHLLRIEITESAYMDNPQQLIMEITQLREYGFTVEMDDFGSGYSSLNMLKDVPINVLKTDLKFLDSEGISGRKNQILDSVVRMAHEIGLEVVAEGVETKGQAEYLNMLHCQTMQGYYFSKPISVEEFEANYYSQDSVVVEVDPEEDAIIGEG